VLCGAGAEVVCALADETTQHRKSNIRLIIIGHSTGFWPTTTKGSRGNSQSCGESTDNVFKQLMEEILA
jgi:hypothetical protein